MKLTLSFPIAGRVIDASRSTLYRLIPCADTLQSWRVCSRVSSMINIFITKSSPGGTQTYSLRVVAGSTWLVLKLMIFDSSDDVSFEIFQVTDRDLLVSVSP